MSGLSDYKRLVSVPYERELLRRISDLQWQVAWLIARARDERLTPAERVSIIAHFPASLTTAVASASQSARPNDRAHDEPSSTTTPDSLGDVMGGES